MKIVPSSRPGQSELKIRDLLDIHHVLEEVAIVGIRGYYRDTMGVPGRNDIGIYDDAIFILAPECFVSFNANTDPAYKRKHIATLKTGLWKYKLGVHGLSKPIEKRYKALVQASSVVVMREEEGEDEGYFGINIHKGSYNSVSSLGCQTIYPYQWNSFIALIEEKMKLYQIKHVPYLLVENGGN